MKKGLRITLIVVAVLLALVVAAFISADMLISRLATKEVQKALAALPAGEASCGSVVVHVANGTAAVNDIQWTYRGSSISQRDTTLCPGSRISIERIEIGPVSYAMLLNKQILVDAVTVIRPEVELWMDEEHPELCFPDFPKDTTIDTTAFPLRRAELAHLHIRHAALALHSVRTKLDVAVDSCSLSVHDLAYDSVFSYCDSIYRLDIAHAAVLTPDGLMRIETRDLAHSDQEALTVGKTHIGHTVAKTGLGDLFKEPVTWIDMIIDHVETSPFNPIRKALAQDYTLAKIEAEVNRMDIFRDARYKPKHIFEMPQTILRAIPIPFDIRRIDAAVRTIHIEFASTDRNIGILDLGGIQAKVTNMTNRINATMMVNGDCKLGEGKATAKFSLKMNKACNWGLNLHAQGANTSLLNAFIRPLVGITSDCMIDGLDAHYSGNSVQADGTFRLLYHGFRVQVHKEDDIPYKIITRNAKTFTKLGNSLLPKSNPTAVDARPRAYKVTWKRNEWQPVPLYFFGPCIDGIKKTMLPGLYVHLQTKDIQCNN